MTLTQPQIMDCPDIFGEYAAAPEGRGKIKPDESGNNSDMVKQETVPRLIVAGRRAGKYD